MFSCVRLFEVLASTDSYYHYCNHYIYRDTTCFSTEGIPALSSDAVDRTEGRESDLKLCEVPQLDEDGELLPSDDPVIKAGFLNGCEFMCAQC